MSKTIVINNCPRMIIGQLPHNYVPYMDSSGAVVKDVQGKPRLRLDTPGKTVAFVPGVNVVDSETLKALRADSFETNFRLKIQPSRAPEVDPSSVGKVFLVVAHKDLPDEKPFGKLSESDALALVPETDDERTLAQWLRAESRPEVRTAIMNRLHLIRNGEDTSLRPQL